MPKDRLITASQVAELLGVSTKTVRRYNADTSRDRPFPAPVSLPSPSGSRPLIRWRELDVRRFAGLDRG